MPADKPVDSSTLRTLDLGAARARIAAGRADASGFLDACAEAARQPSCGRALLTQGFEQGRATARRIDRLLDAGAPLPPLAGLALSLKDLFDVEGQVTPAGSIVLADTAPAASDANRLV